MTRYAILYVSPDGTHKVLSWSFKYCLGMIYTTPDLEHAKNILTLIRTRLAPAYINARLIRVTL